MKLALHSRKLETERSKFLIDSIQDILNRVEFELIISDALAPYLEKVAPEMYAQLSVFSTTEELRGVDFMISIGGDGTLLQALTYVQELEIPIVGVNAGRLGFLASIQRENFSKTLDSLINGYYSIDERTMLGLVSDREDLFGGIKFGLNEFTILKRDTSSMIVVHTYLNGEYLNSYWADGLIVSTPSGSTGYSLSVGGPVVIPGSENFIISPVCPHNLNVRPLIVSDQSVISFEIEGRSKNFLVSLDSRSEAVDATIELAVKKCAFKAKLVSIGGGDKFLETLRKKLNWGLDNRN
ncbi:NAD kinase [Flammeovirga kamogawensis]|uniref:NAD kinase n=1 Tax=Flammeovirga kamogawensis TaxID=373891 RepID=A0ABX8GUI1_9BACT|nr:NAD kinase [Flammeovirga kamogawensis]MBB6462445.1 NAD+ kinase [Flammeovirga kamogawensis]QWG06817.1 NAD kinase [Flammeovirga kamogawensis]TRX68640.1 NAD kinase [Flammeovirga kamogawensis]